MPQRCGPQGPKPPTKSPSRERSGFFISTTTPVTARGRPGLSPLREPDGTRRSGAHRPAKGPPRLKRRLPTRIRFRGIRTEAPKPLPRIRPVISMTPGALSIPGQLALSRTSGSRGTLWSLQELVASTIAHFLTELPYLLGSTNPCPIAVHMEPFSTSVFKVLI